MTTTATATRATTATATRATATRATGATGATATGATTTATGAATTRATKPTTTTEPITFTDAQVGDLLHAAHVGGMRKWQEAVNALMTRPMSSWGPILVREQERTGSSEWNRWISGFRPELARHGWELATTRNARSGRGEFTFRTTAEGKAARAEKSANTRAARAAEEAKRATETVAKAASVTIGELVQAVLAACHVAGLDPLAVADGIKAATKPPIPRPSRRRKTAPAESA